MEKEMQEVFEQLDEKSKDVILLVAQAMQLAGNSKEKERVNA